MNFGIDKLKLHTSPGDYQLANAKGWNKKGGQMDNPPYLLTTKEGEDIFESGIHHNINIGEANLNIEINQIGMSLTFNPSKHKHPWQLEGIGHLPKVKEDIQVALNNLGIDCALEGSILSRIDVTKQVESQRNYIGYKGAMELISDTIRGNKGIDKFSTTDTFKRGRMWNSFYDKGTELKEKYKLIINEKNLIRCETRLMNAKTCQRYLGSKSGINYFSDLMNSTNEHLNEWQNQLLIKELFDRTKTLQLQSGIDLDQVIKQVLLLGNNRYIKRVGYGTIVEEIGIDNWIHIQKAVKPNISKQSLSNAKRLIETEYQLNSMLQNNRETTKQQLASDLKKEFIDNFKVA